jgi:hypothetical protein
LEVTIKRLTYGGGRNQRPTQKQSANLHPIPPCQLLLLPARRPVHFEDASLKQTNTKESLTFPRSFLAELARD